MPRRVRLKAVSGIYHVMLRGINRQQIFFDDEDYKAFIFTLQRFREISRFELYAYCLMGNHVHILLKTTEEALETTFKRIGTSFVYWYNTKYDREGHLFQDRFRSEPVEDERYFLCVLRYILRNPVAAGLCRKPEDYPYSNMDEIMQGIHLPCSVNGPELIHFIQMENGDQCLDLTEKGRHKPADQMAVEWIRQEFGNTGQICVTKENRTLSCFNVILIILQR
ncbi:MAG: transposase [Blautia sp.]|nr:transposase [Blautia sp.]